MLIDRPRIAAFFDELEDRLEQPSELCLVGEACLVVEGFRSWTDRVAYCARSHQTAPANGLVASVASELGLEVLDESPAEIVPLPGGRLERDRPWRPGKLTVYHFDPYSSAIRLIARGDEPDYHTVLGYLELGWVELDTLQAMLEQLLPSFTAETIQQDPAEFRRKFKGMRQMWRAFAASA